jgi:hypothetical protein
MTRREPCCCQTGGAATVDAKDGACHRAGLGEAAKATTRANDDLAQCQHNS